MAWFRRHPAPGLIFHSNRRSQYCSHELQAALAATACAPRRAARATAGTTRHRKPVGLAEAGDGRSDRLDRLLQSAAAAFDSGLWQSMQFEQRGLADQEKRVA